jgi:hypothetical protein
MQRTGEANDLGEIRVAKRRWVMRRRLQSLLAVGCAVMTLTCGCTGAYFRKADLPPPPRAAVVEWPVREYWTGIVFNGARIGFSHFNMAPAPGAEDTYDIRSEAYLRTRFLWVDKIIHLTSFDRVRADLTLQRFHYAYNLDGNQMAVEGQVQNDTLVYTLQTRDQTDHRKIVLEQPLVAASATGLYALLQGLKIGNRHRCDVFDGQTQQVGSFDQEVVAYEESDLYRGPAFKIISRYLGRKATTWIDSDGNPLLEMSMGGILIAALEDETTARHALARAALNKEENLMDFSRIKTDRIISDPDRVTFMQVRISGVRESVPIPSDFRQRCRRKAEEIICTIQVQDASADAGQHPETPADLDSYIQPTTAISAGHPRIQHLAAKTKPASANRRQHVLSIVDWQQTHIRREPVDVFTAMDVLETGKAECQGHALLFAAIARSAGIPTRVVNGVVYVSELEGFYYHSWNESFIDGSWLAVDPTLGQVPADATHVKLAEGERLADLSPLLELIGRIRMQVVDYQ